MPAFSGLHVRTPLTLRPSPTPVICKCNTLGTNGRGCRAARLWPISRWAPVTVPRRASLPEGASFFSSPPSRAASTATPAPGPGHPGPALRSPGRAGRSPDSGLDRGGGSTGPGLGLPLRALLPRCGRTHPRTPRTHRGSRRSDGGDLVSLCDAGHLPPGFCGWVLCDGKVQPDVEDGGEGQDADGATVRGPRMLPQATTAGPPGCHPGRCSAPGHGRFHRDCHPGRSRPLQARRPSRAGHLLPVTNAKPPGVQGCLGFSSQGHLEQRRPSPLSSPRSPRQRIVSHKMVVLSLKFWGALSCTNN